MAVKQIEGNMTWIPTTDDISDCGTMGYTFGVVSIQDDKEISKFSYVHIWRKNHAGNWLLALDIHIPI